MLLRLAIIYVIILHGPFVSMTATDDEAKPHENQRTYQQLSTVAKGLKSRFRTIPQSRQPTMIIVKL